MGKIHYTLFNPSGNMTILVDSPVSPDRQPAVAGKLMELERETEQVGFVRLPGPGTGEPVELRMAGGEFGPGRRDRAAGGGYPGGGP